MDKNKKYLSASRIKTLKSCSWKYWCKYELRLPDTSNDGSSRGSICHTVFEVLGNPRHRKHFTRIIRKQDIFASEPVKRLILYHANKLGVADKDNIDMICEMILTGLNYDFFGLNLGKPTEALSEYDFKIEKNEYPIRYNVVGFIDKLFLYKRKRLAMMRDFKSSAKMFEGEDVDDNLQDWIYSLAIMEHFPEYNNRHNEFLFLRFMDENGKGVVKMNPIANHSLTAFEYELSHYQQMIEQFDLDAAKSHFAYDDGFPDSSEGFVKRLNCGFAKYKGQLKSNGNPMWHCSFKFDFDYYIIYNSDGEIVKSFSEEEFDEDLVPEDCMYVKMHYEGCPRHK